MWTRICLNDQYKTAINKWLTFPPFFKKRVSVAACCVHSANQEGRGSEDVGSVEYKYGAFSAWQGSRLQLLRKQTTTVLLCNTTVQYYIVRKGGIDQNLREKVGEK